MRDALADWAFRVRAAVPWSAPAWRRPARSWNALWPSLSRPARAAAERLHAAYDVEAWPSWLDTRELQEALYVLDVLDEHLHAPAAPSLGSLDVGSKNGITLPALAAARPGPWDLVELDAHRRYADLSTRRGHGQRLARAFPGCRYIADSVTTLSGSYGVITWFLPFVTEAPLRAWGLPRRCFDPAGLLAHVTARLAVGGVLVVVNQGEAERDTQARLFAAQGLEAQPLGQVQSALSPFVRPRYGFRLERTR